MDESKVSVSRVRKSSGSFTFRIEGYSGLSNRIGDSTESPEFELCSYTWQLRIFPGGSLENHRGYISYYLASKSTRSARASYRLVIASQIPGGTDEVFASSGVRLFEAKGVQIDGWGRDKFMTVAMLLNPDFGFCIDDSVVFKVEITVYGDLEPASIPSVLGAYNPSIPSLSKCLKHMLSEEDDADIVFCFEGSATIKAHKCMLRARSPVFRAMLNSPMSETSTGIVHLTDVDFHVMQELLTFLYTDSLSDVSMLDVIAEPLLCASSKYQIMGLVSICENFLIQQFSVDSVVSLLRLADTFNAQKLKDSALQYIAQHASTVMQTKDFSDLNGDLLRETKAVMDAATKRKGCRGTVEGERRFATSCVLM